MLYSKLLQRIFSHKVFYRTVNGQYSGQDQMRALSLVWVHVASLQLCSDMLLSQGGRASPCPTWGWTWPVLPLLSAVLSNQGPQEKDCLSLCVCTAPIASAIIGIKVNKGRNGSNLSYRSQWLGRRIYFDKRTEWFMPVVVGARGRRMARDEWSSAVELNGFYCPAFWLWDIFRALSFSDRDNKMFIHLRVCWIPQNGFSTCASLTTITLLRISKLLWVTGHQPSPNIVSRAIHTELSPFQVGGLYSYLPFLAQLLEESTFIVS